MTNGAAGRLSLTDKDKEPNVPDTASISADSTAAILDDEEAQLQENPMEEPHASINEARLAARKEMGHIGKSGHNKFDNYDYSTLGDYLSAIEPPCQKHGLLITAEQTEVENFSTSSAKMPNGWRVTICTKLLHVATGETVEHIQLGEAYDKGDKGYFKAFTGARKYALQGLFNLYSEDDPEVDSVPDHEAVKWPAEKPNNTANHSRGDARVDTNHTFSDSDMSFNFGANGLNDDKRPVENARDTWPPAGPVAAPGEAVLDSAKESKDEVATAAQAPPTMEQLKIQIYMKATPADLLKMVQQVETGKRVKTDPVLYAEFLKQCSAYVEHQIGRGNWTEESTSEVDSLLGSTYRGLVGGDQP